jgi:hypothetical protein
MTTWIRSATTFVINPVAIALLTSSLGLAASALAPSRHAAAAARETGVVIFRDQSVLLAEGDVEVVHVYPNLTEEELTVQPADHETELAARFNEALAAPSPNSRSPKVHSRAPRSTRDKTWTCGSWEALWQGRGQGRTCEWK